MPVNTKSLTFKNYGVAYAHLTLPVGRYKEEAVALENALAKINPHLLRANISFLTGQSDVMLELHIRDFRSTFQLQYPSEAMGANWLFLVPYNGQVMPPVDGFALNCVIHIRFVRDAYRHEGVLFERRVVADLQELAERHHLFCEVMAGFGWSDLAVGGRFASIEDLRAFVKAVENYDNGAVVQRVLTLVGYDWKSSIPEGRGDPVTPVLFARVLPTHIHQAVAALHATLPEPQKWSVYSTDGKWDLVYTANEQLALFDYLRMHRRHVADGTTLREAGIERFESHVVAKRVPADQPSERRIADCGCKAAFDAIPRIIDGEDNRRSLLPRALWQAILNVEDLFRAASRDTTNCCDAVPSLVRCATAGRRLVKRYKRLNREIERIRQGGAPNHELTAYLAVLARAREDIEDWCTYSERSVSQRTVGRFEEFLAQNERVVAYRGGIQKMLYIADVLTNAYAKKVLPNENDSTFVTLYDPVDTVVNMHATGFIRVPVRYLFFLPLAVTHLWHEVGVHVFFRNYSIPFDKRAKLRAAAFVDNSPARTSQGRTRESGRMYVEVAEMYGDLITLHYGFREDVSSFVLALASAMLEQVGFQSATSAGKEWYLVYLLTRLYLVVEFKARRDLAAELSRRSPMSLNRDAIDSWQPSTQFIRTAIRSLGELLNRELLSHQRYVEEPAASIPTRQLVEENVERIAEAVHLAAVDIDVAHRQFMSDLVWKLPAATPGESPEIIEAFESIRIGDVVSLDPGVDPNAIYQKLQREMIEKIRDMNRGAPMEETFLQSTAALMRSVLLSFYSKERETPTAPPQPIAGLLRHATQFPSTLPDLDFSFHQETL